MNVSYTTVGSIRVPDPVLDPAPDAPIGRYGRMRKHFLEKRHDDTLTALVLSGKLTEHLPETDRTAREQIEAAVSETAPLKGVTERLKAGNQMEGFSAWTAVPVFYLSLGLSKTPVAKVA